MKKLLIATMTGALLLSGCATKESAPNPFFEEYTTQYGVPPFDEFKIEHYMPALLAAIEQHQKEIDAIVTNEEPPTFQNTIEALDYSGKLLEKVHLLAENLYLVNSNDLLDEFIEKANPLMSEHNDNIYMNDQLFERIKLLNDNKTSLNLSSEQERLLEKYYKRFLRSGINLEPDRKERLREINKQLSDLSFQFSQNVKKETDSYQKVVEDETELAGLPESVRQAAAEEAKAAGLEGKWIFTTKKPSFIPVLQYGENRELRKELLLAYANRGDNNNENDNKEIIKKIINLRIEKSNMLNYETYSDFVLEDRMAKTPQIVNDFLQSLWVPSLAKAKSEAAELQKMMTAEGKNEKLEAWDWWFYTEKIRKEQYDLDEEELRPYFKMENVRKGAFDLSNKLWGLNFKKLEGMPIYHPEVEVFEVTDANGAHIGILYTDYYPRNGKKGGAWMHNFSNQYIEDGKNIRPVIINAGNFTPPTSDTPSLLSMDEVLTLFHELGHGLHGLFSQCTYPLLSGTNVSTDFVELPSQVMENWCFEPEVMKMYAFHYETGEVIPDHLIEKINASSTFNQGFIMTEFLAAALLDMKYHTLSTISDFDVTEFENNAMQEIGMIDEIITRYRSTYYSHIFDNGYASGYYSYKWSEVLDADAFQAFVEVGDIFDKEVAASFRHNVLEKGDTDDPMNLYVKFRGREPKPDALMKKRGIY
ncbi:MAG: M3 family metallopeptidase [Marinilabiliaceae bacterium]|nr:M3 family metallopeptidase [Marinilabiliaceae bacterium]